MSAASHKLNAAFVLLRCVMILFGKLSFEIVRSLRFVPKLLPILGVLRGNLGHMHEKERVLGVVDCLCGEVERAEFNSSELTQMKLYARFYSERHGGVEGF